MTFIHIIIVYKATFIQIIAVCTRYSIFSTQLFFTHTLQLHIYTAWILYPLFSFPLLPLLDSPLYPFSTYLAPSSCDRNRPPSSQVACKLTLFAPPFTQLSHPFQFPRTPTAQRLTTTILGPLRFDYAEHSLPKIGGGGVDWWPPFRSPAATPPPLASGLQGRPRGPHLYSPPPMIFSPPP